MPNEYLMLMAQRHRNMNATLFQQHIWLITGTTVLTQTVRKGLQVVSLCAHQPMVSVTLTARHCRACRELAIEHVNWRRKKLCNILFFDESHFSIYPDNRCIFIWKECGVFMHGSVRFGSGGVMVSIDGHTAAIGDDFMLIDNNCRSHHTNLVDYFLFKKGITWME